MDFYVKSSLLLNRDRVRWGGGAIEGYILLKSDERGEGEVGG
jgi:hypothetical protein